MYYVCVCVCGWVVLCDWLVDARSSDEENAKPPSHPLVPPLMDGGFRLFCRGTVARSSSLTIMVVPLSYLGHFIHPSNRAVGN